MKRSNNRSIFITMTALISVLACFATAEPLCKIKVVDESNGWPVPLVELKTTNAMRFYSDNAGVIAFDMPELMGVETWFTIEGNGYGVKPDGFKMHGVRLTPEPGKVLTVKVTRQLPAKRLGRITGGGLFAESQRFGEYADWTEQGILGCDSVQNAVFDGKMFWAWGDTTLAGYPLGLFHMLSGTTAVQPLTSFEPPVQLRYDYFRDEKGKPRVVAKMAGSGPTWVSGYTSLPDSTGKQHLVGAYIKVKNYLTAYESGLCVWNEKTENFEPFKVLWTKTVESPDQPPCPSGHPAFWTDDKGKNWVLFGDPFPRLKLPATFEAWGNPDTWEHLEGPKTLESKGGGKTIIPHGGSIAWNEFRQKWVSVFVQIYGEPSALGELWYTEADAPTGPWAPAVKIVTHANYSFYNPRLHPEFTSAGSPILLFEGTYTATFANKPCPTPRHDYNQVLYRLDLDDPALDLK